MSAAFWPWTERLLLAPSVLRARHTRGTHDTTATTRTQRPLRQPTCKRLSLVTGLAQQLFSQQTRALSLFALNSPAQHYFSASLCSWSARNLAPLSLQKVWPHAVESLNLD